jgi:phage terminase small subunit
MPLTPRRRRFVEEYLIDLDAKAAARRAGFAPRTKSYVTRLMRDPDVARLVADAMTARAARTGITRERVLEEYARIAFVDVAALADWGPGKGALNDAAALSDEAAAAIAMVRVARATADFGKLRIKTFDKMKALEALARLLDPHGNADDRQAPTPLPNRAH